MHIALAAAERRRKLAAKPLMGDKQRRPRLLAGTSLANAVKLAGDSSDRLFTAPVQAPRNLAHHGEAEIEASKTLLSPPPVAMK